MTSRAVRNMSDRRLRLRSDARLEKLTNKLVDEIVGHLEAGTPINLTCKLMNIEEKTFYAWRARARNGNATSWEIVFLRRTDEAIAKGEKLFQTRIKDISQQEEDLGQARQATQFVLTHQYGWKPSPITIEPLSEDSQGSAAEDAGAREERKELLEFIRSERAKRAGGDVQPVRAIGFRPTLPMTPSEDDEDDEEDEDDD